MGRRHQIRIVDEPFAPAPVRAEAVAPHLATMAPAAFGADRLATATDDVVVIDESERKLSAAELYAAAFIDVDEEGLARPRRAVPKTRTAASPPLQLWGTSTAGIPRRGSRCVRLFHDPPELLIERVRRFGSGDGHLRLEPAGIEVAAGPEAELAVPGRLFGAYSLGSRSVRVTLRVTRFTPLFSAAELTLLSRRHPRRYFASAHAALGFLAGEG